MDDLSLTDGVVPIVLLVAGGVALVLLLARRMTRAWVVTVGLAAFAVVLIGIGLNWLVTDLLELTPEDLSGSVVTWIAVAVGAIVLAAGSLIGTPPGRKVLGLVCGVVLLVTAGSQINAYFDEYPTVGALTGADTGEVDAFRDSPGRASSASEDTPVVDRWKDQLAIGQGTVDTAQIPATVSGFVARDAYVYTPPAYDVAQPPRLPVLILVAGQPGGPEDWFQSGELRENLDAFAAAHAGLAPVTVVVDPNGADTANTMCMDSAIAKAETYLVKDVRNWIIAELGIDSNPEHWTFGGWSVRRHLRDPDGHPAPGPVRIVHRLPGRGRTGPRSRSGPDGADRVRRQHRGVRCPRAADRAEHDSLPEHLGVLRLRFRGHAVHRLHDRGVEGRRALGNDDADRYRARSGPFLGGPDQPDGPGPDLVEPEARVLPMRKRNDGA